MSLFLDMHRPGQQACVQGNSVCLLQHHFSYAQPLVSASPVDLIYSMHAGARQEQHSHQPQQAGGRYGLH